MQTGDTFAAILRGINVSGKNMVKMPALLKSLESLDLTETKSYVQSGNIIFKSKKKDEAELEREIHKQIKKDFDLVVPVMVLKSDYLTKIRDENPFLKRNDLDLTKFHVTFLSDQAQQENISGIEVDKYLPDEFVVMGKVIYIFCPGGYGNTKLNNNFFEKKLKVTATTRNWNTVNALVELCGSTKN